MLEFISIPHLTWIGVLDILIVAAIIYQLLVFIKGTRAVQMAMGLALIVAFCAPEDDEPQRAAVSSRDRVQRHNSR